MRFIRRKRQPSERKSPLKFELASTTEIDKYEILATEFFEKVLDINRNECLMTDESSLWDFHGEMSNDSFYSKILEKYGVDVSDITDGNLVKIFQRIAEANRR
jgi:hypothetical protein